jgi:HEXXH motif-containing protein
MGAFWALARGSGGREAVQQIVLGQRSRNIVLLRAIVELAALRRHPDAVAAREAYRSLAMIERVAPTAATTVMNYPLVSAWALNTVLQLRSARSDAAKPGLLAAVTAAAAVRGAVAVELDLSAATQPDSRVTLPSLGTATFESYRRGAIKLRCGPAGAELIQGNVTVPVPSDPHCNLDGWQGLPLICAECDGEQICLFLDALTCKYGTGSVGSAEELADSRTVDEWRLLITDAWRLLVRHHRETAIELGTAVSVLAPLVVPSASLVSGTLSNALGCITMTRPNDAITTALTLAHEVQHVKLTALTQLFPLVVAAYNDHFYAPWRDDPRPAIGLLQGAYAHLGVAKFWKQHLAYNKDNSNRQYGNIEFTRWRSAVRDTVCCLSTSGRLTPLGQLFTQGMLTTIDELMDEDVPAEAAAVAERLAKDHHAAWNAKHHDLIK